MSIRISTERIARRQICIEQKRDLSIALQRVGTCFGSSVCLKSVKFDTFFEYQCFPEHTLYYKLPYSKVSIKRPVLLNDMV